MLQKVQDNFSAAVGVAVIIVDELGAPLTRPSGFSAFCQTIRASDKRDRCFLCDNDGGRMAVEAGEPSIYQCHCGLVDFAAPIIVRGQYLGAVISGQVRLQDEHEISLKRIMPLDDSWQRDAHLCALREEIHEIPYHKLRSAAYTLFYLAGYLVEESYSNLVRQELDAKNLSLMEESKRRADLEKSLREAELKALSYQINPHFLFNVLNTIGRLALLEQAKKTENIVYAFADMMRYVLKRSRSQIVAINSEVEHVRNYLYIQKVRMGDRFTFSMNVPSKYDGVLCPFMVLHPIVENSVNYAVEPRESDGRIDITAYDDGKDMILDVTDNGDGIDPKVIRAAREGVSEHRGRTGIGLHNVDSRLRYFFGDDYGLAIESPGTPGGGTKVRMRFPLEFDPCGI
ncbi:PocR ligand-binding domain-containing protein [Telmatospirillum sp.]|uniref:sensor histidine kinase n=1 Tax=Telmatospirillum sp. TaxID=2079197 RepID=UPI00283DC62E|nr:PocR ligand-binding domain-containing protein [Telmatospirillum sp.]MDR3438604.1 PocR ligand-binding domain-containing protein [Telmatospirillum sp.]